MSGRGREEKTQSLKRSFPLAAGLVIGLDQLTKVLALRYLSPGTSYPVIPHLFHLTLVENEGIAFGLFQGSKEVLLVLITASIGVLVLLGFRMNFTRWHVPWGLGLILGGAVGNWMDRVRTGAVTDFLDFRIWPVFNLADTAITVGVGIFILDLLVTRRVS